MTIAWWDKILGTWAVAAGVSLLYTFFRTYRGRGRYVYLLFFAAWAVLWGAARFRPEPLAPRWVYWALFLIAAFTMLRDSALRYRETAERLRRERMERLRSPSEPPDEDAGP